MRHPDDVKLSSIMTNKLITVRPTESVRRAFFTMREHKVRHLLVTDEDKALVGIVSDRDLRRPDWVEKLDLSSGQQALLDEFLKEQGPV